MAGFPLMARTKQISDAARAFAVAKAMSPHELLFHIEEFVMNQCDQYEAICNGKKILREYEWSLRAVSNGLLGIGAAQIPLLKPNRTLTKEAATLGLAAAAAVKFLEATPDDAAKLRLVAEPLGMDVIDAEEDFPDVLRTLNNRCSELAYRLLHPA